MRMWKRINGTRRSVMHWLTRGLGESRTSDHATTPETIKRILICRINHRLGNLLLVTPLLSEIEDVLPEAKVDLFVKGTLPPLVFKNYPQVNRIIQLPKKPLKHLFLYAGGWLSMISHRYDIAVNVVFNSSSGRISTRLVNARFKFLGEIDEKIRLVKDHEHIAKYPVYGFRNFLLQIGVEVRDRPIPSLDIRLTPVEVRGGRKILIDLVQNTKPTIALYTFATGEKCYERKWWDGFYEALKTRFVDCNIIEVLPIENVSQIGFRAPSFYSRDIRQIAALIHSVDVFVGADSGMMHLASASQTPVIGLFKAHNINTYAPYNNGSTGIDTTGRSFEELVEVVVSRLRPPDVQALAGGT